MASSLPTNLPAFFVFVSGCLSTGSVLCDEVEPVELPSCVDEAPCCSADSECAGCCEVADAASCLHKVHGSMAVDPLSMQILELRQELSSSVGLGPIRLTSYEESPEMKNAANDRGFLLAFDSLANADEPNRCSDIECYDTCVSCQTNALHEAVGKLHEIALALESASLTTEAELVRGTADQVRFKSCSGKSAVQIAGPQSEEPTR